MLNISDIPDWITAETKKESHNWNYKAEDYAKLYKNSPMNHPATVFSFF